MSHLSVQTKFETVSSNLHYYVQKQVQLLSLLVFKYRLYIDIFLFSFISASYVIKFSINLFSKFFLSFRVTFCSLTGLSLNPDDLFPPQINSD
jgi:hypothetical protein